MRISILWIILFSDIWKDFGENLCVVIFFILENLEKLANRDKVLTDRSKMSLIGETKMGYMFKAVNEASHESLLYN